jgi:L-2-hydroxyglutarate oxidase LhgO
VQTSYDPANGIITITPEVFSTGDSVARDTPKVIEIVMRAKREFGRVRVLILAQEQQAMPADGVAVSSDISQSSNLLTGPNDRLAMVHSSALARMQSKRVLKSMNSAWFDSVEAAKTWLEEGLDSAGVAA